MAYIDDKTPPAVDVPAAEGRRPINRVGSDALRVLGQNMSKKFDQFMSDRLLAEQRWLRNLRQYKGVYDPGVMEQFKDPNRSQAYPRVTRVKCISVLSRIMNLMFPGNERNWELAASPSPDMDPKDVEAAVAEMIQRATQQGAPPPRITNELVEAAVQRLAKSRAKQLERLLDDQLTEIGGDQTYDHIAMTRKVVQSGINYGLGVLRGPFVREVKRTAWSATQDGQYVSKTITVRKPQFEFLPVWDFYPDMAAKSLMHGDGYFYRLVMSRAQLSDLKRREDFFEDVIEHYMTRVNERGNYTVRSFENELRSMGVSANVSEIQRDTAGRYEVIVWCGPVSGRELKEAGADVADDQMSQYINAEVWLVEGHVIKADINPWTKLGVDVRTIHPFLFDEDDSSPVGEGLPNVMRDSQMSICAATRMMMDNASVVCGPNLEVNSRLMAPHQDIKSVHAYKVWERDDEGISAQYPAVRQIQIDGHLDELMKLIDIFMQFADAETFVGPQTGGDLAKGPSEPMRTAAGASMIRGDAALPFKDIIRNFDTFTQSVIQALVAFNRKLNPDLVEEGDYNVVARGATSLIAKEVRGMQLDQLAVTLTPEDRDHINERRFLEARFASRDMLDMLDPIDEVETRRAARAKQQAEQMALAKAQAEAETRKTLSDAVKNVAQAQKNSAGADKTTADTGLAILKQGSELAAPPEPTNVN